MSSTADIEQISPRRQFLTLMFCDLSGSSQLASQLEIEELADVLERLRKVVVATVSRHGGKVVRTQGDGSLSVFGHPTPGEHDARRACLAALEIHAEVGSWPALQLPGGLQQLAMHTGVNAGLVYILPGDLTRGVLDVVGDAANTAARIASRAPRGAIVAEVDSLGPDLMFLETSPVEDFAFGGRIAPVRTVRVLGVKPLRRRIDATLSRGLSPLRGRDTLLAQLLHVCTHPERDSRVVEIRGPAGIGKTRLLDELAARLSRKGISSLRGGCESFGLTPVLEPFRQLLACSPRTLQRVDEANAVGDALGIRERSLALFVAHDSDRCMVLLDDWHWADDASRLLLDDLLKATTRLVVVVASRETEGGVSHGCAAISPQPLTRGETSLIVQALVPGANPVLVDELHEYAGGVPLFVEEMCHMLRDRGEEAWRLLRHSATRGGSSAGTWMRAMMAARVDGLHERVWNTAQAAAVAGLRVPRWLLENLVPGGVDDWVLDQLSNKDLLYRDGTDALRFRHGLSRDALYDLIPLQRRTELHRRSLALIEGRPAGPDATEHLEALAHHARAAGNWAQSLECCQAAGEQAMRLGAFDSARRQFFAAIEAAEHLGLAAQAERANWCALIHRLAMTCTFDPLHLPQALPLMERCVRTARELADGELLARSLYWESYLRFVFGQPGRAVLAARESKALAQQLGSNKLLAQVNATLGQSLAAVCNYPEALEALQVGLQEKRTRSQNRGALAIGSVYALACVAGVHADRGDFRAAHVALAQAHELIAGHPNHPIAYSLRNWEVIILAWEQRWEDVLACVEATFDLARHLKALLPIAIAQAVGGYARWRLSPMPQAMAESIEAVRWMENHQVHFYTPLYYGWLVEMAIDAGRVDDARRWAALVLRRARTGERIGEAVVWRALAREASRQGDRRRAWRRLARAEASARCRQSARETALNLQLKAQLLREDQRPDESAQAEADALQQMAVMGLAPHHHAHHVG